MSYHPNFFESGGKVVRHDCLGRLKTIQDNIEPGSLLDVGCSEGFYSFGLHETCGPILAIDKEQSLIDTANSIRQDQRQCCHIHFQCMELDEIFSGNGHWDTGLYLSVHHHIVAQFGLDAAKDVLRKLSEKCDTMFFDMGQKNEQNSEMHKWWKLLPENDDQGRWLSNYLGYNTTYTAAQIIGSSRIHNAERILWKLTR